MNRVFMLMCLPFVLMGAPGAATAADPRAPVRELMEVAAGNWKAQDQTAEDYFSEARLKALYSADFAAAYREASRHPAYDLPEGETTGSPFDYDVIANGQDGCAFEDIRMEDEGEGQVTARFNNRRCMGDDPANGEDTVLIFHVKEEAGRAVIDDIYHVENGNSDAGLKQQMHDIAKAE